MSYCKIILLLIYLCLLKIKSFNFASKKILLAFVIRKRADLAEKSGGKYAHLGTFN